MVSDAAKKKAAAKKFKTTAKLQGKDAADKQAAAMSNSAVRPPARQFCDTLERLASNIPLLVRTPQCAYLCSPDEESAALLAP